MFIKSRNDQNNWYFIVCLLLIFTTLKAGYASSALSQINNDFHQIYEQRVEEIVNKMGAPDGIPVILNLGGRFIFKYNGRFESVVTTPERFHNIKAFSHSLFATDLILQHQAEGSLSIEARENLMALQIHLGQAVAEMDNLDFSREEKILISHLVEHNLSYIEQLLKTNQFSKRDFKQFFVENKGELEKVIKAVAQIQLTLMDQTVNRWLDVLTDDERAKLGVVVATVHQARADELSLQYFAKKFAYRYGEGAQHEKGFVVLEGKFDEESALKLLARHYLDREAATMMFDDPERLQSDLLGPAAHDILERPSLMGLNQAWIDIY